MAGPGSTGPVVLDIGAGAGALIVYTASDLRGREIEVSPVDRTALRTHTAILERTMAGHCVHAAVFVELAPGDYILWGAEPSLTCTVSIAAGEVAQVDWRPTSRPPSATAGSCSSAPSTATR
jgi:hypothetical protein